MPHKGQLKGNPNGESSKVKVSSKLKESLRKEGNFPLGELVFQLSQTGELSRR